jgi:NAD(P)-dependent dehydrogenase (short-subunit alcohol dehydrogenase family)
MTKRTEKVALVTGGSRGIGAATAGRLAREGYAVCIAFRERSAEAEAVTCSIAAAGGRAISVQADMSDEVAVMRLFSDTERALGSVTALVNNVGIVGMQSRIDETRGEDFVSLLATNVVGTALACREAVLRMSTRHGGHGGAIVNVSSMAAVLGGFNGRVRYAASKAAVEALTVGLAREVAAEGIRVNAVRPGPFATDIHEPFGGARFLERIKAKIPLGRVGDPPEAAAAITWLLSTDASFVTGAILSVSGGQ